MFKRAFVGLAAALSVGTVQAAGDDELKALREEIRQLKEQYQKKIEALEVRLQQAEGAAAQAQTTASQAAAQASSRPTGENALNPGVSAVLNGVYANLSQDPARYRINGFVPTLGDVAPPVRGLSLGESELAFMANIDHNFRGTLIASISPDNSSIDVEEGYIQTLSLPNGFTLKAGRFFSAVGYQNQVHAHAWDFTDAPLAMKAFLGGQLNEDGIQLKWVAPTQTYVDFGVEAGRGRRFPAGPDGGRNKNGFGSGNLFAHLGGDIGASTAWQLGLSHVITSPQDRVYTDLDSTGTSVTNSFSGRSRLWVLDGVLKWSPNQNPTYTNFKLQGEYFRRREDGTLTYDTLAQSLGTQSGAMTSLQSGWYLQGVYQFVPAWRVGLRYDRLNSGSTNLALVDSGALTAADFPILGSYNPRRTTAMLDWSPSEFSRVRFQLSRDYSRLGMPDNQLFLQYIVSMGAHGAHRF